MDLKFLRWNFKSFLQAVQNILCVLNLSDFVWNFLNFSETPLKSQISTNSTNFSLFSNFILRNQSIWRFDSLTAYIHYVSIGNSVDNIEKHTDETHCNVNSINLNISLGLVRLLNWIFSLFSLKFLFDFLSATILCNKIQFLLDCCSNKLR